MLVFTTLNCIFLALTITLVLKYRIKIVEHSMAFAISLFNVGLLFVAWEFFALNKDYWSYNRNYTLGWNIANLPVEVILFFIVYPAFWLTFWELIKQKFPGKEITLLLKMLPYKLVAILLLTLYFAEKSFTVAVLLLSLLVFATSVWRFRFIITNKHYFYYIFTALLSFLLLQYVMTALPLISYDAGVISGIKLLTIPWENFLYHFCSLTLYVLVYESFTNYKIKFKRTSR